MYIIENAVTYLHGLARVLRMPGGPDAVMMHRNAAA